MRLRGLLIVGLVVATLGCTVLGNNVPMMEDLQIRTVQDRPVTFILRAHDSDIDPADAGAHPLRFVVLEGPNHGVLIGDLTNVRYEAPHTGYVEITYFPTGGFTGIDFVVITVIDPLNERATGTTTIQIDAVERRHTELLSGIWETAMTFNAQPAALTAFRTRLTTVYRTVSQARSLVLQGSAGWKFDAGGGLIFDRLRLRGDLSINGLSVGSMLEFDPEAGSVVDLLDHWRTTTRFVLFDVGLDHTLYLTPSPSTAYQQMVAQGRINGVDITNTLTLGFDAEWGVIFSQNAVHASGMWCDLQIRSSLSLLRTGFHRWSLTIDDFPIPGFVRPQFGLYIDLALSFTTTEKVLAPTLILRTAWVDCIRLLTELKTGMSGMEFAEVSIYGIRFTQTLPGGIRLRKAAAFDPNKNAAVTGQTDYFAVVSLSGQTASCCGGTDGWGVTTYFETGGATLFDWGMTVFDLNLRMSDMFSLSTEAAVRSGTFGDSLLELTIGWEVLW